ncbi:hypothetical protein J6590_097189 [Homalodisca vitripennis]|nr:hypothetical protein J6590_097189 [Homalodisca vitripennis]
MFILTISFSELQQYLATIHHYLDNEAIRKMSGKYCLRVTCRESRFCYCRKKSLVTLKANWLLGELIFINLAERSGESCGDKTEDSRCVFSGYRKVGRCGEKTEDRKDRICVCSGDRIIDRCGNNTQDRIIDWKFKTEIMMDGKTGDKNGVWSSDSCGVWIYHSGVSEILFGLSEVVNKFITLYCSQTSNRTPIFQIKDFRLRNSILEAETKDNAVGAVPMYSAGKCQFISPE